MYRYKPPRGKMIMMKMGVDAEMTASVNAARALVSQMSSVKSDDCMHTTRCIDKQHIESAPVKRQLSFPRMARPSTYAKTSSTR